MDATRDVRFAVLNGVVSATAVAFLGWLLLVHKGEAEGSESLAFMPAVNAALNATAAVLLGLGVRAVRAGDRDAHRRFVLGAFACSALFLAGYLGYHAIHGDTPYPGQGPLRTVYFAVLITHILGSVVVLPLIFTAFYLAFGQRFEAHKKVTRFAYPIWMYVSVTGVLIFFMLRGAYG